MRISVSGTANQGKTTIVSDFVKKWPTYREANFNYRKLLEDKGLSHSKGTSKETQMAILEGMAKEILSWDPDENIIMDRNPLDNIVYSLWAHDKGVGDIDDKFIEECIPIVAESMRAFDILFFVPITKAHTVEIVDDGTREADETYINEVDAIFKAIQYQYRHDIKNCPFFIEEDAPAIIEIFGDPLTRMQMIAQYIDVDGDAIEADNSQFSPENIAAMEELLTDQQRAVLNSQMKEAGIDIDKLKG
tara:strand:- start:16271 stop:17011 length:741 start_codon:yes stop_codon:yes gene_type:complete